MGDLFFLVVALVALGSAVLVVQSPSLIRAVLWLGVTLTATAALYAMLEASFLAGVQVLVYVGGVITLMIFGVMITRRHEGLVVPAESHDATRGALVAAGLFCLVALAIWGTDGLDARVPGEVVTTADLGRALLRTHVLAFEAVSFLLLAAIIGAIVIARRRDPVAAPAHAPAKEAHS